MCPKTRSSGDTGGRALKGVLFDLDGVLADSEPFHIEAWQRACLDYNIRIERDQFTSWIGHSGIELSTFLIETYDLSVQTDDFIFQQHRHFLDIIKDGLYCFPDLKGLLEKMDERIPKGIVTSGTRYLAGRVLKILDLENFLPLLVTIEDVEHPKPAPDAYITASYALGLRPEECIAVEDSPSGIESAMNAGCYTLGVANTHTAKELDRSFRVFPTTVDALQWILSTLSATPD